MTQSDFRADLHCHSTCSDGSDDPKALLHLAKHANLKGLSITDHDTIDAYTLELFELANELGIKLMTGVEISSELDDQSVHILAYNFPFDSKVMRSFLSEMQRQRGKRNRAILKKLTDRKMAITEDELIAFARDDHAKKTIGRPHIAQLMVMKGYVSTIREAFDHYLKEGALCYSAGFKYSPQDVIDEIHKAGGKAVLAHPHFFKKGNFLKKLLSLSFDGIECHYSRIAKELEAPWVKIANERGLIATGGSDYHGALKPHIAIGCSWVDQETFQRLLH